jgi:hypothetical protein
MEGEGRPSVEAGLDSLTPVEKKEGEKGLFPLSLRFLFLFSLVCLTLLISSFRSSVRTPESVKTSKCHGSMHLDDYIRLAQHMCFLAPKLGASLIYRIEKLYE